MIVEINVGDKITKKDMHYFFIFQLY
jgi:hypothetical protein